MPAPPPTDPAEGPRRVAQGVRQGEGWRGGGGGQGEQVVMKGWGRRSGSGGEGEDELGCRRGLGGSEGRGTRRRRGGLSGAGKAREGCVCVGVAGWEGDRGRRTAFSNLLGAGR